MMKKYDDKCNLLYPSTLLCNVRCLTTSVVNMGGCSNKSIGQALTHAHAHAHAHALSSKEVGTKSKLHKKDVKEDLTVPV